MDGHKNFSRTLVATAPSPATSGTSLTVTTGDGSLKFPTVPFNLVLSPSGAVPTAANSEVVRCTAVVGDVLTIARAQESSTARTVIVGDVVTGAITKKWYDDIEGDLASLQTQASLQAAQIAARAVADTGWYVASGLALAQNATTLTSVSTTIASSLFNKTTHGLVAGDSVVPTGLVTTTGVTNGVVYYVSATGLTANVFRLAATSGGTAITLGGTTDAAVTILQVGKLDMAAGVAFIGTTELTVAAQTAVSTTITTLADATNPKWVAVELDTSRVVQFNQGTAAAAPAFPTPTASRVVLGWLWVPALATIVDTLLTTSNGNAKLIDARIVRSSHPARLVANDVAFTQLTNPTALTTLLAAAPTLPANSCQAGDAFDIEAAFIYTNNTGASTLETKLFFGTSVLLDYTSISLSASATARLITVRSHVVHNGVAIVAGAANVFISTAAAGAPQADTGIAAPAPLNDPTVSSTVDLQVKLGTSSAGATIKLRSFSIIKTPA